MIYRPSFLRRRLQMGVDQGNVDLRLIIVLTSFQIMRLDRIILVDVMI